MTFAEIIRPHVIARSLLSLEEVGGFPLLVECVIDARSVYDALCSEEIRPPTEISLIMLLCQLKEAMLCHTLKRLWWVDTHDMLSDGLTKGICSREALMVLGNTGHWRLKHQALGFQSLATFQS